MFHTESQIKYHEYSRHRVPLVYILNLNINIILQVDMMDDNSKCVEILRSYIHVVTHSFVDKTKMWSVSVRKPIHGVIDVLA